MSEALSASPQLAGPSSGAPPGHQVHTPPLTSVGPASIPLSFLGACMNGGLERI